MLRIFGRHRPRNFTFFNVRHKLHNYSSMVISLFVCIQIIQDPMNRYFTYFYLFYPMVKLKEFNKEIRVELHTAVRSPCGY